MLPCMLPCITLPPRVAYDVSDEACEARLLRLDELMADADLGLGLQGENQVVMED